MSSKNILFVMRKPPYGNSLAREALEAVLAAGSLGQTVSLLFIDDGVLQLCANQHPEPIDRKNHAAMLTALPMYDVDQLFADRRSLSARGLTADAISSAATIVDTDTVKTLLASHHHILSF